ncbi:hypothetical protein AB0H83_12365 [Dactylosporangium sp. NPDC050688]|uniref:hypothetical protein n=1 Tax=Dactylosporangium sp. NPDC050688 TaxID=3157217 RepID=UPI0033E84B44
MPREALRDLVRTLLRRPARGDGFAVRLDWPGYGPVLVCHDLTQFTPSLQRARRRAVKTEQYWSRGPLRPLAVTVVPVAHATFRGHPRECASTACPTTAALLGTDAAGRNLTRSP